MLFGPAFPKSQDELREKFYLLLRRSYLMAQKHGKGLEVYRSCFGLIDRLCAERWAQHTIFPAETALVRRFLAETRLPVTDPDAVVHGSLRGHSWKAIWYRILQTLPRQDFTSVCTVTGAEHLKAAQAAGRGVVIAHSHTLFAPIFWNWLEHEGIGPGITVWQWAWKPGRKPGELRDPRVRALESARELHAAARVLRAGGLVHILADGTESHQQIVLPFCGRERGFRTTFAELAADANALVITADVTLCSEGQIRIEIGPPLVDAPERGRGERVASFVRQYADHLYSRWVKHVDEVSWTDMKLHLQFPPISEPRTVLYGQEGS